MLYHHGAPPAQALDSSLAATSAPLIPLFEQVSALVLFILLPLPIFLQLCCCLLQYLFAIILLPHLLLILIPASLFLVLLVFAPLVLAPLHCLQRLCLLQVGGCLLAIPTICDV